MSALTLLRHVPDGDVATWVFTPVSGHPPITGAMEAALRVQCVEAHRRGRARSVTWHHCDGNAWAAVTDLHRAGRHEDAVALAVLLRWCDQRYTRRAEGIWEIRTEVGRA